MRRTPLARTAKPKAPKPKRCANRPACRETFVPRNSFHVACCPECAIALGEAKKAKAAAQTAKAERAELRARKEAAKPLQYWLKRTEKVVNAYCRERDWDQPCISCGTHDADEWHGGHFIPVGRKSSTRYDPANIHKQCRSCNFFGAGKTTEYEARLIPKIGLAEVERLKNAPSVKYWTREEVQAIEKEFKAKLKALLASRDNE